MAYVSKDGKVEINVRQAGKNKTAWSHHIDGRYMGSKVLPNNNTAIVQNFGYAAADFVSTENLSK